MNLLLALRKTGCFLLILAALMLLTTTVSFAYSNSKAIAYADRYAKNPNQMNGLGTSGYNYYGSEDCTNFVSQCLYAGGMKQDNVWKTYVVYSTNKPIRYDSNAWVGADTLKNYLKENNKARKIGSWSLKGTPEPYKTYPYTNNSSNLTASNEGKTVLFYDWDGDGEMNHSAIFVGDNSLSEAESEADEEIGDLIDQHSYNRKRVIWCPDGRQDDASKRLSTRVYAFELNV